MATKRAPKGRGRTKGTAQDKLQVPLTSRQVRRLIKPREPLGKPPETALEMSVLVAGLDAPRLTVAATALEGGHVTDQRAKAFRVNLEVRGGQPGVHVFPPSVRIQKLSAGRKLLDPAENAQALSGYLPDHLALRPVPAPLGRQFRMAARIDALDLSKKAKRATTVFAPDDRYTFNDTGFPWCTAGRVDTAGGWASGVMIGPRHLLTVSHTIVWNSDNTAGWVKFTPSYFDGSAPFGVAWGEWVYFQDKVSGPTIDNTEEQFDYVVVVLNTRMGNLTGWMGSRTYSDSWDGGNYWSHIGYPGDLASGQRPSFQDGFSLDGSNTEPEAHQIMTHTADVWPGQSGGPMFGWWAGEPWPRAVSVQSWQNSSANGASGGSDLVDLVIRARNDFP